MKKKKTVFLTAIILLLALVTIEGCTCVYGSQKEEFVTIYKIGDNSVTKEVSISEIDQYVNDTYVWSIEPTTLMYAADGRTSYIWNSEVELYKAVCWSIYPPVTIYGKNGATRSCLVEEKQAYLDSGYWFATKEEANPIAANMNPFQKTNIPPDKLEKALTRGLSGYGQAFYDMEQKYGVNSIFAISVAELESGNGTSSAFRNKNNAFGIGPGKRFSSVVAGIDYFGQLMNKPLYYGKTIDRIGSIYCVGGNWAYKVKSLMKDNYAVLGY